MTHFSGTIRLENAAVADEEDESDTPAAIPQIEEGATFPVTASVKEGFTSPPKHFTEDTILSAMTGARLAETTGAEDMLTGGRRLDDAERKGLGTPATRAAILEKLVKSGFAERSKKNLLPTDKGKNLIAVLPNSLTSAKLTAEWEDKLIQVQRGEISADEFMESIAAFTKSIVLSNTAPSIIYSLSLSCCSNLGLLFLSRVHFQTPRTECKPPPACEPIYTSSRR
ncbi:hypothetical protein FACS1894188_13660 [Clostridia bacterium]|nr:hypothetical protein FACS1894188_13660 [Clostridia bacterium]